MVSSWSKSVLFVSALMATGLGACIGAFWRGAGEIDSDPEMPQIHTIFFGSIAGLIVWTTARKLFPRASKDFGRISGGVLTGAVCGPLYLLLVQTFHWNETRVIMDIGLGVVLGAVLGFMFSPICFLLKVDTPEANGHSQ